MLAPTIMRSIIGNSKRPARSIRYQRDTIPLDSRYTCLKKWTNQFLTYTRDSRYVTGGARYMKSYCNYTK